MFFLEVIEHAFKRKKLLKVEVLILIYEPVSTSENISRFSAYYISNFHVQI